MKINNNVITADNGKVLRRISDKLIFGESLSLGYTYYINNTLLATPLLEKPEDYEEIYDPTLDTENIQEQDALSEQNKIVINTPEELKETSTKIFDSIDSYDKSDNVNCFYINDEKQWLVVSIRNTYKNSIEAAELLGDENVSFIIGNDIYTIPTKDAKIMLAKIQRYADNCAIVTATHKLNVLKLQSITEMESYDYTKDYPDKLKFTI